METNGKTIYGTERGTHSRTRMLIIRGTATPLHSRVLLAWTYAGGAVAPFFKPEVVVLLGVEH